MGCSPTEMKNMKNFLFVAAMCLFAVAPIVAAGDVVQLNGFAVDYYCWQLPNRRGLDGALLGTNPGAHTTHCMRDVAPCIANGYILLEEKVNGVYTYDLKYRFDSAGNDMMLNIVQTTSKTKNLRVTVVGEEMANKFLAVSSMTLEDTISNPLTTVAPTPRPSAAPTPKPTAIPSISPSSHPSPLPGEPTIAPIAPEPSTYPTAAPSEFPTTTPSAPPSTTSPTQAPTTPPLISGSGLSYAGKVAIGVILGGVGFGTVLLGMLSYASGVDNGSVNPATFRAKAVTFASIMSCVLAIVSIVMIFQWARDNTTMDIGYLGELNWKKNVFAYHPVLMTCFVMGQVIAVSMWSLIPNHTLAKFLHVILQVSSMGCMITAFIAVVKIRHDGHFATFTTIHSWVGVASVCVFGLTLLWGGAMGLLTTVAPEAAVRRNIDLVFFHRGFGALAMLLCVMALFTGVMDRLSEGMCYYQLHGNEVYGVMKDSAEHYSGMPGSCKIAYGAVFAALIAAVLMLWTISTRSGNVADLSCNQDMVTDRSIAKTVIAPERDPFPPPNRRANANKKGGGNAPAGRTARLQFQMVDTASATAPPKVISLQV